MTNYLSVALVLAALAVGATEASAQAKAEDRQAAASAGSPRRAGEDIAQLRMTHARAVSKKPSSSREVAESSLALAKALRLNGNYGEALTILADAGSRVAGSGDLLADDVEVTRAVLYRELDRPDAAEAIYRKLIKTYNEHPGRNPGGRLTILNNLSELLASQGRLAEAMPLAREVMTGRSDLLGPSSPLTLAAKSNLGSYLARTGDFPAALTLQREVLAARLSEQPRDELALARILHNVAATLDQARQFEAAKDFAGQAAALRLRLLGDDHPDTILSLRQLAGIRFSLGDIAGAASAYRQVVSSLEKSRLRATVGEYQRREYFAQFAQVYKMLAVIEAHDGHGSAIAYADAAKARTLDEIASAIDVVDEILTPAEAEQLREARAAVSALSSSETLDSDGSAQTDAAAMMDRASARLAALETSLETKYPQLRFSTAFQPLSKASIRQALGPDTALLEYVVMGDRVQMLWLAPNETMGASRLAKIPALTETIQAYLALLSAPALNGTAADPLADRAVFQWPDGSFRLRRIDGDIPEQATIVNDASAVGAVLAQALLADAPDSVRTAARWVVVPDGPLAAIPFDTLQLNGASIAERTAVTYTPSIRMLLNLHDRLNEYEQLKRAPMLVFGAPNFSAAPKDSKLATWAELPGSATEVDGLARRYGLQPGKTLFVGAAATERQLRELASNGKLTYRSVVFSTHGQVDIAKPDRNAIVLMGDEANSSSDGYLRAGELAVLHIPANLIVVSACQSGVGTWLDGEGAMGLPFALFASGGAAAVLSHWSIADSGSAEFVMRLFSKIDAGLSPSQALWQTKHDFAAGLLGERFKDPAYWGAFSYFGADRNVSIGRDRALSR